MAFIDSDLRERRRAALKEFHQQQEEMLEKELAAKGYSFVRERL